MPQDQRSTGNDFGQVSSYGNSRMHAGDVNGDINNNNRTEPFLPHFEDRLTN